MTWTRVEDQPGVFTLRRDGVDVGTVSFLPTMPTTGESLFPTVLAGVVIAALNDYSATVVVETEMRYRAKGWPSAAAYEEQLAATRSVTADLPPPLLEAVQVAWDRHSREWTAPMTPEQMFQWQDEILTIATTDPEVAA